jgi:hypothetical protein
MSEDRCFAVNNLTNPQVKNGETLSKSLVIALANIKLRRFTHNRRLLLMRLLNNFRRFT